MRNKLFIERHHQFFVKVCGLTSTFRIKIHAREELYLSIQSHSQLSIYLYTIGSLEGSRLFPIKEIFQWILCAGKDHPS